MCLELAWCFSLTFANVVIVDVTPAAGRWGRGCVSDLREESHLKGELPGEKQVMIK